MFVCLFICFVVALDRALEWLYARFSEVSPEAVDEERKSNELAKLEEEMMKNKKRIKSMMEMLEAQNKLLRSLAQRIDPSFEKGKEKTWVEDHKDGVDGHSREGGKESEEPTDDTSVEFAREEKASDALFESGL